MNETVVTIEDATRSLPELVERLHASGEAALLVKGGRPLARIVPIPIAEDDLRTFLKRWCIEHPEPDEGFGKAIEESRKSIQSPRDPWE